MPPSGWCVRSLHRRPSWHQSRERARRSCSASRMSRARSPEHAPSTPSRPRLSSIFRSRLATCERPPLPREHAPRRCRSGAEVCQPIIRSMGTRSVTPRAVPRMTPLGVTPGLMNARGDWARPPGVRCFELGSASLGANRRRRAPCHPGTLANGRTARGLQTGVARGSLFMTWHRAVFPHCPATFAAFELCYPHGTWRRGSRKVARPAHRAR